MDKPSHINKEEMKEIYNHFKDIIEDIKYMYDVKLNDFKKHSVTYNIRINTSESIGDLVDARVAKNMMELERKNMILENKRKNEALSACLSQYKNFVNKINNERIDIEKKSVKNKTENKYNYTYKYKPSFATPIQRPSFC